MTKELEFLIKIVKEAEKISNEHFDVFDKEGTSNSDLVTNLDTKIEEFLIGEIKKAYPKFDIVSEEFNYHNSVTKNCFIIDPIDGTVNFANNIPLWGIQVCMYKGDKPVAAVIDLPRQNEFYYADKNGAFMNDKPIKVSQYKALNKSHYSYDGSNTLAGEIRMREISNGRRRFGAQCVALAYLACGRINGVSFNSDKPWDYEPGHYIAKQAGGYLINKKGSHVAACNEEFAKILDERTGKIGGGFKHLCPA